MANISISFTIQGDSDGYVTFECPFCGSEFNLKADEYQDKEHPFENLFCPYCGLTREKSAFLSYDVREQAQALAQNYMIEELNKPLNNMQESLNRGGLIKTIYKPIKK